MAIECDKCGDKYDPIGCEPEDFACPTCEGEANISLGPEAAPHEYWRPSGTPWTPKKKDSMPIKELADLVDALMSKADDRRAEALRLIVALSCDER